MNRIIEHLIIYLQWFIVTSIAFPVGMLAGSAILASVGMASGSEVLLLVTYILTGIMIAIAQLLVLNRNSTNSSLWIAFSAMGIGAGGWITARVLGGSAEPIKALLAGMLGGLAPGLLQMGLLSSSINWKRGEWLLLTVVAWMLAYFAGSVFISQMDMVASTLVMSNSQRVALIGWAISGMIAVLLLLFFTPIARRRELRGRITWLP